MFQLFELHVVNKNAEEMYFYVSVEMMYERRERGKHFIRTQCNDDDDDVEHEHENRNEKYLM
jgi:hypothetical protein